MLHSQLHLCSLCIIVIFAVQVTDLQILTLLNGSEDSFVQLLFFDLLTRFFDSILDTIDDDLNSLKIQDQVQFNPAFSSHVSPQVNVPDQVFQRKVVINLLRQCLLRVLFGTNRGWYLHRRKERNAWSHHWLRVLRKWDKWAIAHGAETIGNSKEATCMNVAIAVVSAIHDVSTITRSKLSVIALVLRRHKLLIIATLLTLQLLTVRSTVDSTLWRPTLIVSPEVFLLLVEALSVVGLALMLRVSVGINNVLMLLSLRG